MDADTSNFFMPNNSAYEFQAPETGDITFHNERGAVFTIKGDGRIIRGTAFDSNDKASVEFLDSLAKIYPQWKASLKQEK